MRPILNLKQLNASVEYAHFKMDTMKDLKELIRKDQYMVKLDLKSTF